MGQINIYKIDRNKKQTFYQIMASKLELIRRVEINKVVNDNEINFEMSLYIFNIVTLLSASTFRELRVFALHPKHHQSAHFLFLLNQPMF